MYTLSYFQMNTGCILIMLILLNNHVKSSDKSLASRSFTWLLLSMIVYATFDFVCGLQENDALVLSRMYVEGINVGFFCSSMLVSYFSFFYCQAELKKEWLKDQVKVMFSFLPVVIGFVLFILSLKYHFFFYIDEACNYTKGNLYWLMLLLTYSYIMFIGISNLHLYTKKENFLIRSKLLTLSSFVIFPLIFGAMQAFCTGVSVICLGGTLAMIQVSVNLQSDRITMDPLTQINNRTRLKKYLYNVFNNSHRSDKVCLVMIDIDDFKMINDTYGHIAGDNALKDVAELLSNALANYTGLLARYGGDEFCIVCQLEYHSVQDVEDTIIRELQKLNELGKNPFEISLSLGFCVLDDSIKSVAEFIDRADQQLYATKQKKKGLIK